MTAILIFAVICGFIIVYHHVIYPVLLRVLATRLKQRTAQTSPLSLAQLPTIELILPAYNEADVIADKLRNVAALDYPADKLKVTLVGDGCADDTIAIAREVAATDECLGLNLDIQEFKQNRGKIAVLNLAIEQSTADIVALSDISALINKDGLLLAAERMQDPQVGVVNSSYHFANYSSEGEKNYWRYQSTVKQMESFTGSVIGAHGALYFFRRHLFQALPADTINDDFILPMNIVAQGYKAVHEPRIEAVELECVQTDANNNRRKRIAAGNLQQAIRLRGLLSPSFKGVAFNFLSGKVLRVLMPLCLMAFYIASLVLAAHYTLFALLAVGQTVFYALAYYQHQWLKKQQGAKGRRLLATIYYFASGYWFSFIGMVEYLSKSRTFRV